MDGYPGRREEITQNKEKETTDDDEVRQKKDEVRHTHGFHGEDNDEEL